MPVLHLYEPHNFAEMGIAVEGMAQTWPSPGDYQLATFEPLGKQQRTIEVFNKVKESFTATAKANAPWITISHTSVLVADVVRIQVSINWNKAPKGESAGTVHITGTGWGGASIAVKAMNSPLNKRALKGLAEADGYIAIEAEHYQRQGAANDGIGAKLHWGKIPEHGRTLSPA